jgi:hypothetical protein
VATYRNPFPHPVDLSEYRDEDGEIWQDTQVLPGAEVTWPIEIGGFELVTAPAKASAKKSTPPPAAAAASPATDAPAEQEATS